MAGQHKTATVTAGPLSPSFTERRDELRHAQAEIDKLVEEGTPEAREKLKQSIVSRQRLLGDDADADADLDIVGARCFLPLPVLATKDRTMA